MAEDLKWFFSLVSGELYQLASDEVKNLDSAQVPLLKKPSTSCRKCYGRFHIGKEIRKKYYIPCPSCMRKCTDWKAMGKDGKEITINTPRTV